MTDKGVVLLFGAFNPFTNAHLLIGKLAKEQYPQYEICYVPSKITYMLGWKGMDAHEVLPEEVRYDLIAGSIKDMKDFSVSDIEIKGLVDGKTYNTVSYFRNELGYKNIVLCMGTDKVPELESWYRGHELISENNFLIITRNGETLEEKLTIFTKKYKSNFYERKNINMQYVSASKVREAIEKKDFKVVKQLVPEYVYEYLVQ